MRNEYTICSYYWIFKKYVILKSQRIRETKFEKFFLDTLVDFSYIEVFSYKAWDDLSRPGGPIIKHQHTVFLSTIVDVYAHIMTNNMFP